MNVKVENKLPIRSEDFKAANSERGKMEEIGETVLANF